MLTIFSIILYTSLICAVFILAFLNKKYYIRIHNNFTASINSVQISSLILIIFAGIRYDVGTDYLNYISSINWINSGPYFYSKSIILHYFAKLIQDFDIKYYWFFIISNTITVAFVYKALKYSLKDKIHLGVLFFLLSGFYFYSFNGVRACVAVSIVFYSIKFINEKKIFKYILLIIFASTWHTFSLIFIPLYFFINKKITGLMILVMLALSSQISILLKIITYSLNIPYFNRFSVYLQSEYLEVNSLPLSFGFILIILIAVLVFFLFFRLSKIQQRNVIVYFNLYFLGVIFYILSFKLAVFIRIMDFFYYFQIFSIPIIVQVLNKKSKPLFIAIVSCVLYIVLIKQFIDPHRKFIPYKTIFTEYEHNKVKKILFTNEK